MQPAPNTGWRVTPLVRRVSMQERPAYRPILSRIERAAYAAAHRILTEANHHPELAGPGARRSRQADDIARIIMESLGK